MSRSSCDVLLDGAVALNQLNLHVIFSLMMVDCSSTRENTAT